jgi:hypothetical protein
MAGTRQYNNLIALFDNWDSYVETLQIASDASGTLQEQQDIYMESTEAHIQQMETAWEDFKDSLLDSKTINFFVDLSKDIGQFSAEFTDSLGGGVNLFGNLISIGGKLFSGKIANEITSWAINSQRAAENMAQVATQAELVRSIVDLTKNDEQVAQIANMKKEILSYGDVVTQEQHNEANAYIQRQNDLYNQQSAFEAAKQSASDYLNQNVWC